MASACLVNLYIMLNKGVHWEGLKKREMLDPTDEGDAVEKKFKSLFGPLQLLQVTLIDFFFILSLFIF